MLPSSDHVSKAKIFWLKLALNERKVLCPKSQCAAFQIKSRLQTFCGRVCGKYMKIFSSPRYNPGSELVKTLVSHHCSERLGSDLVSRHCVYHTRLHVWLSVSSFFSSSSSLVVRNRLLVEALSSQTR